MVAMMDFQARAAGRSELPGQAGNDHPTSMPTSVYPTADGYVNVAAAGNPISRGWRKRSAIPPWRNIRTMPMRSCVRRIACAERGPLPRIRGITLRGADRTACESRRAVRAIYKLDQVFEDEQVRHIGMRCRCPIPAVAP